MPGKLNLYQIGNGGINIVKVGLQPADDELLQSQNAELVIDSENGGISTISKRAGYANLGDSFGAGLAEMAEVRFISEDDIDPPSGGGATVTLHPISDISNTGDNGWTTAPLFSKLDEATTPVDSDFITTFIQATTLSNNCVLGMTSTAFSGAATAGTLKIRFQLTNNGGGIGTTPGTETPIVVAWKTGTTTLGSKPLPVSGFSLGSFVTFTLDIFTDLNYAGGSFDWTTVRIDINCEGSAFLTPGIDTVECSWIEMSLTHA